MNTWINLFPYILILEEAVTLVDYLFSVKEALS